MVIKVKNCQDCPFCNNDNEYGYSCNVPGSKVEESEMTDYDSKEMPNKCPLRNWSIIVSKEF